MNGKVQQTSQTCMAASYCRPSMCLVLLVKCEMSWDLLLVKSLSAEGKRLVCFSQLCALPEVPIENKNWPFRICSAQSCTVPMSERHAFLLHGAKLSRRQRGMCKTWWIRNTHEAGTFTTCYSIGTHYSPWLPVSQWWKKIIRKSEVSEITYHWCIYF